ncbi:acyltransferase family protein [Streptomyces monashensis]|uniref:acyltransferase family protein n=1 Tax=Streptomyces monashensis TaxID=1678012 RepID=UPI000A5900BA|nr:acyltransferase family protein [Streptomyces monashensis]
MFDAASPLGHFRRALPPSRVPADGVPGPRTPAGARERQPPAGRPGASRDAFFDNVKYLAIVLVAAGHCWAPLKGDSRVLEGLYNVVYTFHMPAFVIISGYFSRSFDMRPDRLKRLVTGIAVPYVVFQTAYLLFRRFVGHSPEPFDLVSPWYLTWFLCALFVWRLSSPLWKLVRRPVPVALGIAMVGSVSMGTGGALDFGRVLQFLPFFVLGLRLEPEHFTVLRRRWVRIASVPVAAVALAVGWWSAPRLDDNWFYRESAAQKLGAPWWTGPLMTLALFACALLLTAVFFAWVPRRRTWFTALGAGTLYGYLLHGFVVKTATYGGWFDHAWLHGPLGEILVTLLAGAVVTLLCTKPVQRVFRFAMEPRMGWAFRQDAAELARELEKKAAVRESVTA